MMTSQRGFTLLISILLSTVAVTLGVALIDIAYKQLILASSAKHSQYGFYAADSAMECALYWDQKFNGFSFLSPMPASSIKCQDIAVTSYASAYYGSGATRHRRTTFNVPCPGTSQSNGKVSVYKYESGDTAIYANGFSTCVADDQRRIERGLKVFY